MKDSLIKTILVAAGVCLVCSILVSFTAVSLKPIQEANQQLYKKRIILNVAGLIERGKSYPAAEIEKLYSENISPLVIDVATGNVIADVDPTKVDEEKEAKDAQLGFVIEPKDDIAKIKRHAKRVVIYQYKENNELKRTIFPIVGKGLWSTVRGFIALDADMNTVCAIDFYEHGETPGLGGEIENPNWQHGWIGKKVYAADSATQNDPTPKIEIVKAGAVDAGDETKSQFQVDGIAGSTLTCRGVSNTVRYWLGQNGFGPYIEKICDK